MKRQRDQEYIKITPSKRQLAHQKLEFYAFFHFTINTFTGKEWGDGNEKPDIFNPEQLDAFQWVKAIKAAGMKGAILTCKHHDGFCLWPSKYTEHSIKSSPYKKGQGDIVKEVAEALQKEGMKFGIYLSPWDRNQKKYGQGNVYNDYFVSQLEELLTGYGEIFSVWFDGACGEGSNGKKQVYDWNRYYEVIRRLQPKACITVCGPDIRWCGNEAGNTRSSEWSVVPKRLSEPKSIQNASQQNDDTMFRQKKIESSDLDLGSRALLKDEDELIWYPAEVNTSIRPGWFYHIEEDNLVKSLEELVSVYENSVGGNATFLLNIPPTPEGLVHKHDVKRLEELGAYLNAAYDNNLIAKASVEASHEEEEHPVSAVKFTDESYYKPEDGQRAVEITISWEKKQKLSRVVLMEQIELSQRIERFELQVKEDNGYQTVYEGTTVGYKKIVRLEEVETDILKIIISDSRICPTIKFLGIY